jgi:hypothetical protein
LEAEIIRIEVPDQPGQKTLPDPMSSSKKYHASVIPATAGSLKQEAQSWPAQAKNETLFPK